MGVADTEVKLRMRVAMGGQPIFLDRRYRGQRID